MERDEPITKARGNPATKTVISIQQNVIPKRRDKIIDILIAEQQEILGRGAETEIGANAKEIE